MNVTCEYMMTSSDQILWTFSRLNGPIYFVKLIFLKLKMQIHIASATTSCTCCKDIPDKAGLIPPTEHILA